MWFRNFRSHKMWTRVKSNSVGTRSRVLGAGAHRDHQSCRDLRRATKRQSRVTQTTVEVPLAPAVSPTGLHRERIKVSVSTPTPFVLSVVLPESRSRSVRVPLSKYTRGSRLHPRGPYRERRGGEGRVRTSRDRGHGVEVTTDPSSGLREVGVCLGS